MANQIQDAYIVAATRTPVGKARGVMRNVRPDDMLAHVMRAAVDQVPSLDPKLIDDAIIGCAMPEAEQGMNVARMGVLLAGLPDSVAGLTINRFCSSGVQAVAMAADRIRLGEADAMIGGGTETMSMMPSMMGNKLSYNPAIFEKQKNIGMAYGMGLTAEKVAERWQVSREDQDAFALASHQKAVAAINAGKFNDVSVSLQLPGTLQAGTYKLLAKVDATNVIAESNESNNVVVGPNFAVVWQFGAVPGRTGPTAFATEPGQQNSDAARASAMARGVLPARCPSRRESGVWVHHRFSPIGDHPGSAAG